MGNVTRELRNCCPTRMTDINMGLVLSDLWLVCAKGGRRESHDK